MSDGIDFEPIDEGIDFQPIGQGQSPNTPYTGPLPGVASQDEVRNEPGLLDVSIPDAQFAQGAAQLGGLGARLAAKPVGALLDAIPATENMVPTVGRIANNQTLKGYGGTMGQLRQMAEGRGGREALDEAAQFSRDKGLSDVWSTNIGREKNLEGLLESSGEKIGALRNEAGAADKGIINRVISNPKIDKYLGEGSASKELGGVDTALNDIKEIGGSDPTHSSLAEAATYINKNAAGNKLYQPVNAETDVANILSRENNADIAQKLGSDKAQQYVEALGDQTKLHPLKHLQDRGELREMGGRGGLGVRAVQAIADSFGYRLSAKGAALLHDLLAGRGLLEEGPGIAAKSTGKMVPASISDWVSRQKQ